jgi:hypothetical protein
MVEALRMLIRRLTDDEMATVVISGLTRLTESRRVGRDAARSEATRTDWHRLVDDSSGAAAELVWANYLSEEYQTRLNTFHSLADVGDRWEVRSSSVITNDSCIVRDDDPDDRWYVFIQTDQAPAFKIRGMILGRDAKRTQWWRNPHGKRWAYFVPTEALTAITPATLAMALGEPITAA